MARQSVRELAEEVRTTMSRREGSETVRMREVGVTGGCRRVECAIAMTRQGGLVRPGRGVRLATLVCAIGIFCTPVLAFGQIGAGNGHGGNEPEHHTLDPHIADLIRAENPTDPTAFMLAARSDLKLSDSEVTALYRVRMELQTRQASARNALDTLGPNAPVSSIDWAHITPATRDSLIAHRKAVAAANGELHDAALIAEQQALAILTPDQRSHLVDVQRHVEEESRLPHDSIDAEKTAVGRRH